MTDEQVRAGGWLIAKLIKEHGLQINDIVGHKDLAATSCPGKNFRMADLKDEVLGHTNPNAKKEVVKVSKEQTVSSWAKESFEFVKENGISDGTRPKDAVTREEQWTMLKRLYDLLQK